MKTTIQQDTKNITIEICSGNRPVSRACGRVERMTLNGGELPVLAIFDIETEPEYRRQGLVRQSMAALWQYAEEQALPVSILHPFSDGYYRKFGYERVADHRILEFPISALDFAPRCTDFVRLTDRRRAEEVAEVYNAFAKERNIMFRRDADCGHFFAKGRRCYLHCDAEGRPDAYLSLSNEKKFEINQVLGVCLHVHEFAFTSPAALMALLGFLRMFEGEMERIRFENSAIAPEVEQTLRHYTETEIRIIPDLMARIHNVKAVFEAVSYPAEPGRFTIRIEDAGSWQVTYQKGKGTAERLPEDAGCDLSCDRPALARLLFGHETYTAETARYLPNTTLQNDCADLFRAFPHRPGGLFEHF